MAALYRYAAFISYSSKDAKFARRLHRALESYGIPSSLGKFDLIGGGGKRNRIYPVFRDREELSAGHLGDQIEANLNASAALIVVCSPHGAASPWVQKEIEFFVALGRHDKIFAIISDTAPLVDAGGADSAQICFPPAFRGDALAGDKLEPLAADARKNKDGFRNAWLKIVAGMIGVSPGQIVDRDMRRRRQQRLLRGIAAAAALGVASFAAAWMDAQTQRALHATDAERMLAEGQAPDAVAHALAGMPSRGDVIFASAARSRRILGSTLRPRVEVDYGLGGESVEFVDNGNVSLRVDGAWTLWAWDTRTGSRRAVVDAEVEDLALSPDAQLLATLENGQVVVRDVNDFGSARVLGEADDDAHRVWFLGNAIRVGGPFAGRDEYMDSTGRMSPFRLDLPRSSGRLEAGGLIVDGVIGGTVTVYDLEQGGMARVLPAFRDVDVTPDLKWLAGVDLNGNTLVFDLRSSESARRLQTTSPLQRVNILPNGSFVVGQTAGGNWLAYPTTTAGGAMELPQFEPQYATLAMAAAAPVLVADSPNRAGLIMVDLSNGSTRTLTAQGARDFIVSDNGEVVAYRDADDGWYYTRVDDGAASELGMLSRPPLLSADGEFIVVEQRDKLWTLFEVATGEAASLGNFGNVESAEIVRPRRLLVRLSGHTVNNDQTTLLYNLSEVANGSVADTCRINSGSVRPFRVGTASSALAGNTARNLMGRLRNPCDWRGLLAVFPNAEYGDGWFEGLRQWFRRIHVRHFGGADYACDETTSAASSETRARRREICERFANSQTPPPA